jgi:hypothetical protein
MMAFPNGGKGTKPNLSFTQKRPNLASRLEILHPLIGLTTPQISETAKTSPNLKSWNSDDASPD